MFPEIPLDIFNEANSGINSTVHATTDRIVLILVPARAQPRRLQTRVNMSSVGKMTFCLDCYVCLPVTHHLNGPVGTPPQTDCLPEWLPQAFLIWMEFVLNLVTFHNQPIEYIQSGLIINDISDHLPIFQITETSTISAAS